MKFDVYPDLERLREPLLDLEPLPERLDELRERPDFLELLLQYNFSISIR